MRTFRSGLVEQALVHKRKKENVFVRDLRRAIPRTLPVAVYSAQVEPALTPLERELFHRYYVEQTGVLEVEQGPPAYLLVDIPLTIPQEKLDQETSGPFSPRERQTLQKYYRLNEDTGSYRLVPQLTEMDMTVLQALLHKHNLHQTDPEKILLANLFERLPDFPREDVYFAGLHADPSHPYYFEHPNEHVPGMMIMEAARQFSMACWHVFGNVPVKGSQFIMNRFHVDFHDYVDLSFPAGLKTVLKEVEKSRSGEWTRAVHLVTLQQRGEVCAEVMTEARVISQKIFMRLREGREQINPAHRFYPIATIHHQSSLISGSGGGYIRTHLSDLGMEGVRLEVLDRRELAEAFEEGEVLLSFEEIGFIRSRCRKVWIQAGQDQIWMGLKFLEMAEPDRKNLRMAIKQYCQLRVEREKV